MPELFDMKLRALRQGRASKGGPALFLHRRAFDDCLERVELIDRRFERALLVGEFGPDWRDRLCSLSAQVDVFPVDMSEDAWPAPEAAFDLIVAVGTLDTVNDLPLALRLVRHCLQPGGLFIGALAGGDTLPRLRSAMRAADAAAGAAAPHVHPRIEPAAMAPLLEQAGFVRSVVDVDRVSVSYPSVFRLISDLRGMGATNVLLERPRYVSKAAISAAGRAFADAGTDGRTVENFEILHFAAWAQAG